MIPIDCMWPDIWNRKPAVQWQSACCDDSKYRATTHSGATHQHNDSQKIP